MKIQIKNRYTDEVMFEEEAEIDLSPEMIEKDSILNLLTSLDYQPVLRT